MLIEGFLVGENLGFLRAVHDPHDIYVAEARAALAPVGVGHTVVAADFATRLDLAAFGNRPVEKPVETRDSFTGIGGFYVFQESGETPDDFLFIQGFGNFARSVQASLRQSWRGYPSNL